RDPNKSARWWIKTLNVSRYFSYPGGVIVGNANVNIALHKGTPRPEVLDHVSFQVKSMRELRAALVELKRKKVEIEDPGHEIGSEGGRSKNMGLWFHDPDGYRWELSVLAKTLRKKRQTKGG
ncbi:MAG TPA: VOC family protein, partial [Candidatus Eremiobacteraceae bacterium]|nr:VOC family protein [Candidatus Eremiobacteraceae bacterium]